jgi:pimeloyl-ACP methyl ester carboxylesterase
MDSIYPGAGLRLCGTSTRVCGERGLVVLLHGGGQTRHSWAGTARALAAAGWSSVSLDARGHGDSEWAADGDYTMDALLNDLVSVVGTLGAPPVLVGASMGGLTSLLAVGEIRVRARGLVLVDVAPRVEASGIERIRAFMTAAPNGFSSLEEAAASIVSYNPHRRRPANLGGLSRNLRLGADGRLRWHWDPAFMTIPDEPTRTLRHRRYLDAAMNVRVPTLMIRGARSDIVSEAGADELLRTVPDAADVVVPGAGHMVAGDDNGIFSRHLLAFLDALDTSGELRTPA